MQHSTCFVHCVLRVRLTILFLTMFHVWTSYVLPSLHFHMWEFLLLLSHCVFTCEVTVFCCTNLCCSHSLNFTCEYFTVSRVNTLGYSAAAFLTIFHMWIHLVSHVRKLTVLRLHLFFTREVVNHFRHSSFSLNYHVWINYLSDVKWVKATKEVEATLIRLQQNH
jgi:hypothetical protein